MKKFFIEGFSRLFRLDRVSNRSGILLYVKEDIPSNLIDTEKFLSRTKLAK